MRDGQIVHAELRNWFFTKEGALEGDVCNDIRQIHYLDGEHLVITSIESSTYCALSGTMLVLTPYGTCYKLDEQSKKNTNE